MGLIDGALAEFALLDARLAVPETWTMTEAAPASSRLLTARRSPRAQDR